MAFRIKDIESRIKSLASHGEDIHVEYKSCIDKVSGSVYETICSFLNHGGGTILLGVNDDGKIIGVNPSQAENMKKAIINATNNPELFIPSANIYPEIVDIEGKTIIALDVQTSDAVYQFKKHFYDRNGDADVDVTNQGNLLQSLFERKSNHIFEKRIVEGLTINDLDHETFEMCRQFVKNAIREHPWITMNDEEILRSCQLIRKDSITGEEHLCYAALLLFGTDDALFNYCPRYRIELLYHQCSYDAFQTGLTTSSYDNRETIRCNLLKGYGIIQRFVLRYLPDKYYVPNNSVQRQDLRWLLFREIGANMLVHADYSLGYASFFDIYTDRVVTRNRTRLVSAAKEDIIGIDQLENYTKNPLIVNVFRNLGWVEDLGSGSRKIKTYAPLYYSDADIKIHDEENFVFSITYSPSYTYQNNPKNDNESQFKTPLHALVYTLMKQMPKIKTTEITNYVKTSHRTVIRIIADLKDGGWIERSGQKKDVTWKILK